MGARSQTGRRRSAGRGRLRPGGAARTVALEILLAWDASRESVDALFANHSGADRLPPRDRDLVAELVRGTFRWQGRLDWMLAELVRRPLEEVDRPVLWILRLGLYQFDRLDRIPAHAIVDTAVETAKRFGSRGAASFVNAVLRRATSRTEPPPEPDASEDPVAHLVARTGHPAWWLERSIAQRGFSRTLQLAAANNRKPSLTLRAASDRVDAAGLLEACAERGIPAEPGEYLPDAVRLPDGWHPFLRELLESGTAVVQDEAAGLVAHVARPAGGLSVLDLCAAPGGKALHFAALCGDASVVAADVSARRLGAMRQTIERTGVAGVRLVVADGTRPATRGGFSRVLVDAPCSNSGVFSRRPDARWRRTAEDLPRLAALQGRLLDAARTQVGAGGLLVYSTCSLEPEENEDVIQAYRQRHPSDEVLSAGDVLPAEVVRDGALATNPADHGIDGAFAAAIRPGGGSFPVMR